MRLAFLVFTSLLVLACGRSRPLLPAPDVGVARLLQAPRTSLGALSELRGKVVVLDFWATWCRPCVETIPHLNKMAEEFAGKPVVFLSVTNDDPATVERFLLAHPMKPWIGLDPDDVMGRAFGVREIPQTFVIDPYGRISLRISPSFLYASDIQDALDAKAPPPAPKKS
ncbi:MAG: TlpA family protein disulfide reductase [Elusimicrobia bacterium]|nr:TlpA family protein disulfide reductase [Elusimicrobiota bacterium]